MDRISTFNINADMATLQTALTRADLPPPLREPLQAMVAKITAAAAQHPVSIYVASSDEAAPLRDHFAYLLARALAPQMPSTLVVDCDFLHVGLSGLVPEKDALGFLDLLLYGSSLGVITQEAQGGVKTIGAGSFPVTKRMPFVLSAFEEASHRLVQHARCAVFVGPLDEDEGGLHPLCGAVDLPILVRELDAVRPGAVDPIEEQIAAEWDSELLSVRVIGAAVPSDQMFAELLGDDEYDDAEPYEPAGHVAPPPPVSPATLPPRTFAPPPPSSAPAPAPVLADLADLADPMPSGDRSAAPPRASRVSAPPRRWGRARAIVAVVFVVAVAAVGPKWLWRDRAPSESADRGQTAEPAQTLAGAPGVVPADTNASERDTSGASVGTAGETSDPRSVRPTDGVRRAELTDTGGRSGGTVLINPEDIHVIEEIRSNWPDQFFIHISSFRKSVEARSEVTFLESHEFPVFIVFLDLGAKGNWYRVYAGPFPTREAAREVKKSLDDIPSVRFTRITKIEE